VTGVPVISTEEFALLFGVSPADVRSELERQDSKGAFKIPADWVRTGRLRTKEYQAATGRTDMRGAIAYYRGRGSR